MPPIRRVRQHVNPLSHKYAIPAIAPDWSEIFANPHLPLHLDIGCAKGDFVREMAQKVPDWNFLGLEIRAPLVERALIRRNLDRQRNLHFVFCNANNSLKPLLENYPSALQCVSIQFPDPWFKKRHQKRRVVQPELVSTLATLMTAGGKVWLQSDIETVCQEMCDRFDENPAFARSSSHQNAQHQKAQHQNVQWLDASPFPAKTDRERVGEEKGLPVYRAMYFRQGLP
ncbi:tRNA (guanosine(46)-N7)-methyltransferase TrmB [cf. Phormidesmis sp. LEGE 11477]|uniref:tRNA (guanosine(46)-N7)-methyltransferase TrmB n=1 Tax=cf. Phormidesmis sp. LEGE 11477 TaxID=1828680 RepID=UPI00187E1738|nr:tRNA (guanosine(46)-N7)-methyltransferase TrmB [cf. Phormidesmis sp. LEGE 11477]MBE9059724.1 tRNA (guanosine(46)-N7)-methyltransferase TrmB [cf. Phormidesmis sp. LEGE 11477]